MRALIVLFACVMSSAWAASGNVTTFAGGGTSNVSPPVPPASVPFTHPVAVAFDATGTALYFAAGSSIYKSAGGAITVVSDSAGSPTSLAIDAAGNLYYGDSATSQVKKLEPNGTITVIAGTGTAGFGGDGGPATSAQLNLPSALALLGSDVLVADTYNVRIRRISAGTITTVAGNGAIGDGGDGGPAVAASLGYLGGIVADGSGGFYLAQGAQAGPGGVAFNRVRHVDAAGTITPVASIGDFVLLPPGSLDRDAGGNLYLASSGFFDFSADLRSIVYRITPAGVVSTFAGGSEGFSGDNGPATSAKLKSPRAVAVTPAGELYIADSGNNRIRKVDAAGVITTAANGNVTSDPDAGRIQAPGDGGPPTEAMLKSPDGIAVGAGVNAGLVLIADVGDHRVRAVTGGIIQTWAGNGTQGAPPSGFSGNAALAPLDSPRAVALASFATLPAWVGDTGNSRLVNFGVGSSHAYPAVEPDSMATRVADVYVASAMTARVQKLADFGPAVTVAGSGSPIHGGDGGPATSAGMTPNYITLDDAGNLYISDAVANRVRKVDTVGMISTVAGNGTQGSTGDGGPATAASLDRPAGVAFADGVLYIAEAGSNRIRAVRPDGVIEAFAGTGAAGFGGDGGPASAATFDGLRGMAWHPPSSSLLVADSGNHRVRRIEILDTIPDPFLFANKAGVALSAIVQSDTMTPSGYNGPAAISATGGEYSIGCTATFTTSSGTLSPGDSVCVRHVSAALGYSPTVTTLTVGGTQATFTSYTVPAGVLELMPLALVFPADGSNATQPVTVRNTGGVNSGVVSLSPDLGFSASHDCALVVPGATCTIQVTNLGGRHIASTLSVVTTTSYGAIQVSLSGGRPYTIAELIERYYTSILGRAPDAPGLAYWQGEAARMSGIGANVSEAFFAMAAYFFASPEYFGRHRDDTGFVTDLYNTFFRRAADIQGLGFWRSEVASGTREVVLTAFLFSAEFAQFMGDNAGATPARAEVDMVMDFYRGLLGRLPDPEGFAYWVARLRAAQCQGALAAPAINNEVNAISDQFMTGSEYAQRNRTPEQFVGDLYNAFLRRGGDAPGVQFWIGQLRSGALTRQQMRQQFAASAEFNLRVSNVIAQGCLP